MVFNFMKFLKGKKEEAKASPTAAPKGKTAEPAKSTPAKKEVRRAVAKPAAKKTVAPVVAAKKVAKKK